MVIMGPMLMLEWVLVLLLAAVVLTNLAERLAVPYPSLLAIAGAGLAFLPFAPQIQIESKLALALFVAPALLDAAFDTSPRGLRDNAIPVASMAVVAVVLTTAAIAFLGWRFAGLPIAAAIALGAIVAPPDAVAANEVLRHLRIPQRIGLVLQGESMLNDATALWIYRAAVLAAAGSFSLVADAPILVLAAVGGLVVVMCSRDCIWSQARLCATRQAAPFCNSSAPSGCGFCPSAWGFHRSSRLWSTP
jgi:monovalent cation/hydrogen antiporter